MKIYENRCKRTLTELRFCLNEGFAIQFNNDSLQLMWQEKSEGALLICQHSVILNKSPGYVAMWQSACRNPPLLNHLTHQLCLQSKVLMI